MVASKPNLVNLEPRPSLDVARPSGQSSGRSRIQAAQLSSEDFWRAALPLISGAMSSALRAGQVQLAARIRRTVETLEPPGLKRSSISPVNWPISGEGRCGFQSGRGLEADRRKRGLSTHVQVGKGRKIPIVQGLKPATWQPPKPPYVKLQLIQPQHGRGLPGSLPASTARISCLPNDTRNAALARSWCWRVRFPRADAAAGRACRDRIWNASPA
jgi:hypothetical protein